MGSLFASERWAALDRWNQAIAETYFPFSDDPQPVYLSIEDEDVRLLADEVGVDADEAMADLAETVRGVLNFDAGSRAVFEALRSRVRTWETTPVASGKDLPPPPVLALLAVATRAAEIMERGDEMSSANYHGRFSQLLGVEGRFAEKLEEAYRRDFDAFWKALEDWLDAADGDRGFSTVKREGHPASRRYIGPTVGQALVRRADRQKLVGFFQAFDLAPGVAVAETELEPMLGAWLDRAHSPAPRLQQLWRASTTRAPLVEAVASALEGWDGSIPVVDRNGGGVANSHARVRLALEISTFPKKFCRLSFLVNAPDAGEARSAAIRGPQGDLPVTLYPVGRGQMSLGPEVAMDPRLQLEGVFRLQDDLSGGELVRSPRAVVPFKQDVFSQLWIEADQVQPGDELRIAARESRAERLEELLDEVARPGWSDVTDTFGDLPDGWRLYRDVEVLRAPTHVSTTIDDFSFLVPSTARQIRVTNGLRIPTRFGSKWHVEAPPEVVAGVDSDAFLNVVVTAAEGGPPVAAASGSGGGVVLDLSDFPLEEAQYTATLFEDQKATVSVSFELVSGEQTDPVSWQKLEGFTQPREDVLGFLGVESGHVEAGGRPAPREVPAQRVWENAAAMAAATIKRTPTQFATIDLDSCLHTGSHRTHIETPDRNSRGRPVQKFVRGECSKCGLTRMFHTDHRRVARVDASDTGGPAEPRATLPAVRKADLPQWDLLIDSLSFLGGGPWSVFERLALQIEQSGLFVDQSSRSLEGLGHIAIRRNPATLKPEYWEIADTRLVPTSGGAEVLAGHWPRPLVAELRDELEQGDSLELRPLDDGPDQWVVHRNRSDAPPVGQTDDEVEESLGSLPPLSQVLVTLPRRPFLLGTDSSVTRFNCVTGRWEDADTASGPGAYRVRRFGTDDVVRTREDVERAEAAVSTVQMSKHLAALMEGRPLMAHAGSTLAVPKGADLPGLYGRVAVACSGRLPRVVGRSLVYEEVPASVAARLFALMTS